MGKIFSWDEILNKRVPEMNSFSHIAKTIRERLEAIDSILGGIICGSVLKNSHTVRSDIDCLVVYEEKWHNLIVKALQDIYCSAARMHIPVGFIPVDLSVAKSSSHHISLSFAAHLDQSAMNGGVIRQNPLPFFNFDNKDILQDVHNYVSQKMRKLESGNIEISDMGSYEPELYRLLQKALEAPVHIARKMLLLRKVKLPDDSKEMVAQYYSLIATDEEKDLFRILVVADENYTRALLLQIEKPNKDQYFQDIMKIIKLLPDSLRFARLNALRI